MQSGGSEEESESLQLLEDDGVQENKPVEDESVNLGAMYDDEDEVFFESSKKFPANYHNAWPP